MKKTLLTLAALAACSGMLLADRITLSDGSVINGQIKSISGGKAVIATDFAGEITVDQGKIGRLVTDAPVSAANAQGEKFNGPIDTESTSEGGLKLAITDINYLWTAGMEDPTLPPGRKWDGEFSADIAGKTGNTEKFNGGAGIKANLVGPIDKLSLSASLTYERENGVVNTKRQLATADYERRIMESTSSWYVTGEYEKEPTSGLKRRTEGAAGYGWYAIDRERTKLRFRVGLGAASRKYTDDSTSDTTTAQASLHFEQAIDEWGQWVTDISYHPALKDFGDYRILHESTLDIPLLVGKPISLRLGISNEYNSRVPVGTERMETTYFGKLVYKWK